jgi:hypothetical protein
MVRMFIHHRVEDYPQWRRGYDAFDEERRGMGVTDDGVFCAVEDSNDVTVFTTSRRSMRRGPSLGRRVFER